MPFVVIPCPISRVPHRLNIPVLKRVAREKPTTLQDLGKVEGVGAGVCVCCLCNHVCLCACAYSCVYMCELTCVRICVCARACMGVHACEYVCACVYAAQRWNYCRLCPPTCTAAVSCVYGCAGETTLALIHHPRPRQVTHRRFFHWFVDAINHVLGGGTDQDFAWPNDVSSSQMKQQGSDGFGALGAGIVMVQRRPGGACDHTRLVVRWLSASVLWSCGDTLRLLWECSPCVVR